MIKVSAELVRRTVGELRRCGVGRRECVVYWVAAQSRPDEVVDVIHPTHLASRFGYEIDSGWLTQFMFSLADDLRMAIAQVHTHPGPFVDHSPTDDEFVLVPSPGFVSIVVPEFATSDDPADWGVHVLEASGRWRTDRSEIAL